MKRILKAGWHGLSLVLVLSALGLMTAEVPLAAALAAEQGKGEADEGGDEGMWQPGEGLWIDPRCKPLPFAKRAVFIHLSDGRIMCSESIGGRAHTSITTDYGKTWSAPQPVYTGPKPGIPDGDPVVVRTRNNVIVMVYMDMSTHVPEGRERLDVWAIRSLDEGKSWVDRQRIFEGYCGALISMIQTSEGHIVVPVQTMLRDPIRNALYTYVSEDDGKTWKRSNLIDLGGHHDHDGAMEPTLVELRDGRLWMLMRTTLGRFWEAYSDDYGYSWRVLRPSQIRAPSSPGYMIRLASGRLALVYNNRHDLPYPEYRNQLAICFSEDEGKTWTEPSLIALQIKRYPPLFYPYLFEARPGELWVATWGDGLQLCVGLNEADFVVRP